MFIKGNKKLLKSTSGHFAVAGCRRGLTTQSKKWLQSMVEQLTPENVLVSGLAIGTDTFAHRTALRNHIPQIAVLPSGIQNIYPKQNTRLAEAILADGGCLVSLSPDRASPSRNSFIERNEVIVDLCHMLIVPQFEEHSGTRHTVDFAKAAGKYIIVNSSSTASGNQFILNNNSYKTIEK